MSAPRPARPGRSLRAVPDQPAAQAKPASHGPYNKPPCGRAILPAERTPMLADALRGVRLGAFDRQAIEWLCRWVDTPTFLALLGILQRARQATPHLEQPPAGTTTTKPTAAADSHRHTTRPRQAR